MPDNTNALETFNFRNLLPQVLPTAPLGLGSAVLLVRFRLKSLWIVLGGVLIGLLVYAIKN